MALVYFISFFFIGGYCLLALFTAVILDCFSVRRSPRHLCLSLRLHGCKCRLSLSQTLFAGGTQRDQRASRGALHEWVC